MLRAVFCCSWMASTEVKREIREIKEIKEIRKVKEVKEIREFRDIRNRNYLDL